MFFVVFAFSFNSQLWIYIPAGVIWALSRQTIQQNLLQYLEPWSAQGTENDKIKLRFYYCL